MLVLGSLHVALPQEHHLHVTLPRFPGSLPWEPYGAPSLLLLLLRLLPPLTA